MSDLKITMVGVDYGTDQDWSAVSRVFSASSSNGVANNSTITVGGSGGYACSCGQTACACGGYVGGPWIHPTGAPWTYPTATPYVYPGTPTPPRAACRFCSSDLEMGITIQNKKGDQHHVCLKCLKEIMQNEKVKELLDLIEPLAVMAEVAKQ